MKHSLSEYFLIFILSSIHSYSTDPYKLLTYTDFTLLSHRVLKNNFLNTYIKVYDINTKYPLIAKKKCTQDFTGKCRNFMYEITKFEKGKSFYESLPVVLLIAGFHGDEVTGSNALYNLIKIFLKYIQTNEELNQLLDNVRLLIVPTLNIEGFLNERREEKVEEELVDPNRDFPFNLSPNDVCFRTTTAQIMEAIFKEYIVVGTLTFHGGDNSISYPWGNFGHEKNPKTGDQIAFEKISEILQTITGENQALNVQKYNIGTMQDVVYDVHGGFEDWAYAASWDKDNVSTTCGKTTHYPIIKYTNNSNRAFVYLVEAGYEKRPDADDLGNELAIFHPDNDDALWGHVSRNTFLALKFSEFIKPFVEFEKIIYNRGLILKFVVKGCLTVNDVSVEDRKFILVDSKIEQKTGYHYVEVVVTQVSKYIPELRLNVKCDANFKQPTDDQVPQTHLVKLRTESDYKIENGNYFIEANETLKIRILNIKTGSVKDGYLLANPDNLFVFTYRQSYKIDLPGNRIHLTYSNGYLKVDAEKEVPYTFLVQKFATSSCCSEETNGDRIFFEFHYPDFEKQIPMSPRFFFELLGRFVYIKDPVTDLNLFFSKIESNNNDKFSNLLLPHNGLTCASEDVFRYYFVKVTRMGGKKIKFELFTNIEKKYNIKVGNFNLELLKNDPYKLNPNVFSFFSVAEPETFNDLRILGSILEINEITEEILGTQEKIFTCSLGLLNPDFDEIQQIANFEEFHKEIVHHTLYQKPRQKKDSDYFRIPLLIFVFTIFMIIVFLYARKINGQKNDDEENFTAEIKA